MDKRFRDHVESLVPSFLTLTKMEPQDPCALPKGKVPKRGVYVLFEAEEPLYAGRSNNMRQRLRGHCRKKATHHTATLAFRLAREVTGFLKATYKAGKGSREGLMKNAKFRRAFRVGKTRIRGMKVRYVQEDDPTRQALLEVYVAVALKTPYNSFDNH
jgi:predicted GIY-YIG superfamily endonuclease